jgi:hypothetical protein
LKGVVRNHETRLFRYIDSILTTEMTKIPLSSSSAFHAAVSTISTSKRACGIHHSIVLTISRDGNKSGSRGQRPANFKKTVVESSGYGICRESNSRQSDSKKTEE